MTSLFSRRACTPRRQARPRGVQARRLNIGENCGLGATARRGFVGSVVTIEQALTARFLHRVIYAVGEKFAVGAGGRKLEKFFLALTRNAS